MILGIDASRANRGQKSGVEAYAFFVIQELKKIIPESWNVVLYCDSPLAGTLAELPNNWTQKILAWPPKKIWTHIRLSMEMILHPVDVLFISAHVPPIIHPKKTVMTVHDIAAVCFPETYNRFERWYSVFSARCAIKYLPAIIVPSRMVKDDLMRLCPNADSEKIHSIHLGVNPVFASHGIPAFAGMTDRLSYFCHSGESRNPMTNGYILYIGRLEEKKNTARLVKAYDRAIEKGLACDLILVGKPGYGYEKIKQAIADSPNKNSIKIIPWLEEKELADVLQNARMFVFPSLYEGFGLPVLEAFASRVPVIASTAGSLPEVAGDAAILIDPFQVDQLAAAMIELNGDEIKRAELIARGVARVTEFSWQKTARETWDVLKSL